ncbi:hypothetical protein [Oryzibacter oryziterrae]|nr:hypothetical protein [Oryzibacter oryziterrae]
MMDIPLFEVIAHLRREDLEETLNIWLAASGFLSPPLMISR